MADFILERGAFGERLVVTGSWTDATADYVRRARVPELYLNHALGWTGDDIEFVRQFPWLLGLGILDFSIRNVSPVHALTNLRALEISTYCETPIDFGAFPELEKCVFYWREGSDSLFAASLRTLFLHRYSESSSQPFSALTGLRSLSIANSALEDVTGLGRLSSLQFLGLYNLKKLRSLNGLELLLGLEALEVNGCRRIESVHQLSVLVNLRRLQLNDNGKIASLAPIRSARWLEEVLFYESTNIADGDLSPLESLTNLRKVSFQNRKHYSRLRESLAKQ